jgi:hypothetical protein
LAKPVRGEAVGKIGGHLDANAAVPQAKSFHRKQLPKKQAYWRKSEATICIPDRLKPSTLNMLSITPMDRTEIPSTVEQGRPCPAVRGDEVKTILK